VGPFESRRRRAHQTNAAVQSVSDIQLAFMPYSHSVATMLGIALAAYVLLRFGYQRPTLALAVAIGIASHLVLDLVTHAPDLPLAPGVATPKLGLGLYGAFPIGAFVLELLYGALCWWIYRGGRALLIVILVFNVADLSLLSAAVPGPEAFMANQPALIVGVILLQIVVTLFLVGWYSQHPKPAWLRSASGMPPAGA
jgi:membrane-bound metal-dependent hydrolase YbcI (DUF457 family)